MRFIDDVDLAATLFRRGVHGPFPEVPGVIDSPVRCRVDLYDVEGRRPTPYRLAAATLSTRLTIVLTLPTVEGHRQDPREGGLPDPARTAEEVSMTYPAALDRPPKGF